MWNLPVAERDQEDAARPEHAGDLDHHLDRPGQILDRDGDQDRVERRVRIGQRRVGVEVVDRPAGQPRVAGELDGIHPQSRHPAEQETVDRREVRYPRAHQVEHVAAGSDVSRDRGRHCGDRAVIDVLDEPGVRVEHRVGFGVDFPKPLGGEGSRIGVGHGRCPLGRVAVDNGGRGGPPLRPVRRLRHASGAARIPGDRPHGMAAGHAGEHRYTEATCKFVDDERLMREQVQRITHRHRRRPAGEGDER